MGSLPSTTNAPPSYSPLPPAYSQIIPNELSRILHLTAIQKETDDEVEVSKDAIDLVEFLWHVLCIDYTETLINISPIRHAKFTRCAMQLHYNTLSRESTSIPDLSIVNLDECIYKPAKEVDILPEAIDMVLRQYLKSTSETSNGSRYTGCVERVFLEKGIQGIKEKFYWDGNYFHSRLRRFDYDNKRKSVDEGMIRVTREFLPVTDSWRQKMERRSEGMLENAERLSDATTGFIPT